MPNSIILFLKDEYKIKFKWDTLDFQYSVQFNNVIESGFQIIENFEFIDIYYEDNIYNASLRVWSYPTFYFDLTVSKDVMNKIFDYQSIKNSEKPGSRFLVVRIEEIKKIKLKIESHPEDDIHYNLKLEVSDDFIGKGELIDFITFN